MKINAVISFFSLIALILINFGCANQNEIYLDYFNLNNSEINENVDIDNIDDGQENTAPPEGGQGGTGNTNGDSGSADDSGEPDPSQPEEGTADDSGEPDPSEPEEGSADDSGEPDPSQPEEGTADDPSSGSGNAQPPQGLPEGPSNPVENGSGEGNAENECTPGYNCGSLL